MTDKTDDNIMPTMVMSISILRYIELTLTVKEIKHWLGDKTNVEYITNDPDMVDLFKKFMKYFKDKTKPKYDEVVFKNITTDKGTLKVVIHLYSSTVNYIHQVCTVFENMNKETNKSKMLHGKNPIVLFNQDGEDFIAETLEVYYSCRWSNMERLLDKDESYDELLDCCSYNIQQMNNEIYQSSMLIVLNKIAERLEK